MSFFEVYKSEIDHQDQRDSFFSLGKRDAESFLTQDSFHSQLLNDMKLGVKKIVSAKSVASKKKSTVT